MIPKDTTTTVNFFVTDTDGLPATGQASNISASISINGAQATSISDTIAEKGSGWYYFNHTFSTAGNVFIDFVATNCVIMPWEDTVVEISSTAPSAADNAAAVWSYSNGRIVTNTIPSTAQIALAVWSYEDDNNFYYPYRTIKGIEYDNHSMYQPYGYGHDEFMADTIWGFDTSTLLDTTTAAYRLSDIQDNAARPGDAMTLTAAYNAAKTASQLTTSDIPTTSAIAAAVWSDTTIYTGNSKGNRLSGIYNTAQNIPGMVWMVSADYGDGIQNTMGQAIYNLFNDHATAANITNAQAAIIAAMPDVSGLSTFDATSDKVTLNNTEDSTLTAIKTKVDTLQNTDISTLAKSSELSGLSTFNASTDKVTLNNSEDTTLSAIKTKVDSLNNTDVSTLATKTDLSNTQTAIVSAMPSTSGLATSSDVSSAKSDIISAIPPIPNDYAKSSELAGLSTFDSSIDTVQLDSTQLASLATGSEITTAKEDIITAISEIDIDTSELATSTDVAVIADMLKQLDSGVLHWSTTATTLTLFNDDNTVMKTYALQRDIQGNIVRIDPINV